MKKYTTLGFKIATIGFLALSMAIVLFPIAKTPTVNEVAFVWNISQLTNNTHGAANQRDYLFQDDTQVYSGTLNTTGTTAQPTTTPSPQTTNTSSSLINSMQAGFNQVIASGSSTGGTFQGALGTTGKDMLPSQPKSCTTPRGQVIEDKDFVLAYEQRDDVATICNIERRICNNGTLEGTYPQRSCKENVSYDYKKTAIISYNEPVVNPLIQPGPASNAGANFSTDGKVNQTKDPTNMRGDTNNTDNTITDSTSQTVNVKPNCTTPRNTQLAHGQFVKAYKTSLGLIDMPCETELRLCVNGSLKGSYVNSSCTFKNMTYNDYMAGNTDITKPTPADITSTLTTDNSTVNIFDWIRNLLK